MAMQIRSGGTPGEAFADINVTPMADVMIVLLIIFMVMAPLIKSDSVVLPRAENVRERPDDPRALLVRVTRDEHLSFQGRDVATVAELEVTLRETMSESAEGSRLVFLRADEGTNYGAILTVMSACRRAGSADIAFVTDPLSRPTKQGSPL